LEEVWRLALFFHVTVWPGNNFYHSSTEKVHGCYIVGRKQFQKDNTGTCSSQFCSKDFAKTFTTTAGHALYASKYFKVNDKYARLNFLARLTKYIIATFLLTFLSAIGTDCISISFAL